MKKLIIGFAAVGICAVAYSEIHSSNTVGYFTKTQTAMTGSKVTPTGIMSFQWDPVDGQAKKLWNSVISSAMGTAYNHGTEEDPTPGWTDSAPKIQVRLPTGGYATRWYCDDAWDDDLCPALGVDGIPGWAMPNGALDVSTTITLGQGAWVSNPVEDGTFTICGAVAAEEADIGGDSSKATLLCGGGFPVAFKLYDPEKVVWTLTPGTAYNHGTEEEPTPGWTDNAPKIQVRLPTGGYATRWYCDDAWDDDLCPQLGVDGIPGWAMANGTLDVTTTVDVGGGFWMDSPTGDKKIFVRVKNPIK